MKAYIVTGRFNPPTIGHESYFKNIISEAKKEGAKVFGFTSTAEDDFFNPLCYQDKIKLLQSFFPEINWINTNKDSAKRKLQTLIKDGYDDFYLCLGTSYQDKKNIINCVLVIAKLFFPIKNASVKFIDSKSSFRATTIREYAQALNKLEFIKCLPTSGTASDKEYIYNIVRGFYLQNPRNEKPHGIRKKIKIFINLLKDIIFSKKEHYKK